MKKVHEWRVPATRMGGDVVVLELIEALQHAKGSE